MKLFYLPIEAYKERYTEVLTGWTIDRWVDKVDLHVISGEQLGKDAITTGSVLDAYGRAHWATTQVAALVKALRATLPSSKDAIYIDDMFTPGYEAVPYILSQLPAQKRPRIFTRNHAQSVDPDDFTHPMRHWMRHYEYMVHQTATAVFCASSVHREMMQTACLDVGTKAEIVVVGLPYDEEGVRGLSGVRPLPIYDRPAQVIYSSRFDAEKNPHFFLDIVEALGKDVSFVLCTGADRVRGLHSAVDRLYQLQARDLINVRSNCTKTDYYRTLQNSRVQINTARQDFVSNTAIEASTFGVITLAPAFRSFPETLRNNHKQMFVPWSLESAIERVVSLINHPTQVSDVEWLSRTQNRTLDRILDFMLDGTKPDPWWEEA